MRRIEAILAIALAVPLAGCVISGKPKTATAVPPAPAPPPVAPAPAPPPEPLSIPQTQVVLPPPQPIPSGAVPPETTEAKPETPPPNRLSGRRPGQQPAVPPRTEPPAVVAPAAAPPTTPVEPPRALVQEIVPETEKKRLQDSAQNRKREIRQWLEGAKSKRLPHNTVNRINSFLKQSDDAERRGEMREADALAERAQILLRELQSGR